jgi:hypothetical protein
MEVKYKQNRLFRSFITKAIAGSREINQLSGFFQQHTALTLVKKQRLSKIKTGYGAALFKSSRDFWHLEPTNELGSSRDMQSVTNRALVEDSNSEQACTEDFRQSLGSLKN